MATTDTTTKYQCPGERRFISEPVHLARLAAFYPACRECVHRHDTGQIPLRTLEQLKSAEHRVGRDSLLTGEGVRGVYLNEITRETAADYASALGLLLWRAMPLTARDGPVGSSQNRPSPAGPLVVVGIDERPSAPDVSVGVVRALRTMSCRVIDIGQVTRPCFWYAVAHMQAAAGIHISGSGCAPVWTGLDFVQAGAVPISAGKTLTAIEEAVGEVQPRPSRQAGQLRSFHATLPYEAGLWKHFHALRPLKVVCGSPSELTNNLLSRIFEKLPCELFLMKIPSRERDLTNAEDTDLVRLGEEVRLHRAHLGMLIDDDAQGCAFLDECGALITARDITRLLIRHFKNEHPGEAVVVESSAASAFPEAIDGGTSLEGMSAALTEHAAVLGGGETGRYWFREAYPACDAVLTLAHILQVLSRSDADFSRVVEIGS